MSRPASIARRLRYRVRAVVVPPMLRALSRCPPGVSECVLGAVGVVQGCVQQPSALRRALRWAARQEARGWDRWRVAFALVANRGRFIALKSLPAMLTPEEFGRRVEVRGLQHAVREPGSAGLLFVGFHLGPGLAGYALKLHGFPHVTIRRKGETKWLPPPRPEWAGIAADGSVRFGTDPADRVATLLRVRRRLARGESFFIAADGSVGLGEDTLRIDVHGGQAVLKAGWWWLRRQTGARTIPVLAHVDGRKVIVTLHPPLPSPVADPAADLADCRARLEEILSDYVRRHPDQCHSLAFWPISGSVRPPLRAPRSQPPTDRRADAGDRALSSP